MNTAKNSTSERTPGSLHLAGSASEAIVYAGKHYGRKHRILLDTGNLVTLIHEPSGDTLTVHGCDVERETPDQPATDSPQTPTAVRCGEFVSLPKGAKLYKVKIIINQESDGFSDEELGNYLEIETPDCGGGKYITIEGRWAMNDENEINQLAKILKDVLRRAG